MKPRINERDGGRFCVAPNNEHWSGGGKECRGSSGDNHGLVPDACESSSEFGRENSRRQQCLLLRALVSVPCSSTCRRAPKLLLFPTSTDSTQVPHRKHITPLNRMAKMTKFYAKCLIRSRSGGTSHKIRPPQAKNQD
jgi:hypothetical protein